MCCIPSMRPNIPMRISILTTSPITILVYGWFFAFSPPLIFAAPWNPDPSLGNPDQHRRLYEIARHYCEVNFDPDADLVGNSSPNPPNKRHHGTGASAAYAYGLLLTGDPADDALANKILRRVIPCQDTKPDSPTYGAFNWSVEDKPQDLNSAAFVGLTLVGIVDLDRKRPCLDPDLRSQVENSVRLATQEIMRRNINQGYTNIALVSVALASAGEKFLAVPGAGAWAQAKLDALNTLADDGEFAEYLSPTYTGVALSGAYAARKYAFSPAFAASADITINHLWKQVALSYHAPTYQLGGPYCRAYGDNMLQYTSELKYWLYLGLDGSYPLSDTETAHDWGKLSGFGLATTPISPRPEFKQPRIPWRQWTALGSPGGNADADNTLVRHFSQYKDRNFTLGTVAAQDEWKQKRNLVAFWRNASSSPYGANVGFCQDESNEAIQEGNPGFPGEKVHFYSQQMKDAALVALVAARDVPLKSVSTLVFDEEAVMDAKAGSSPFVVKDGSITTYLYPVSNGRIQFGTQLNTNPMSNGQDYFNVRPVPYRISRVTRPWSSADIVGTSHVLAYLVVFRPSHKPPPKVSDLVLKPDGTGASAKVDGTDLSISF